MTYQFMTARHVTNSMVGLYTVIPMLLLLCGLWFCVLGILNLIAAQRSTHWPTVPGVIHSSLMHHVTTANRADELMSTDYQAHVVFIYHVDGRVYENDRIDFAHERIVSFETAQQIVNRYPTQQQVVVHYNPQLHASSVLVPGIVQALWHMPVVGVGLMVLAAVMFVVFPRLCPLQYDASV